MAITVIASTKLAGASGGTTSAIDTTGANCIAVFMAYGGTPTLTDSKGNTYTAGTSITNTVAGRWYYCFSATVGTGHTFTVGGGSTVSSIVVLALADVASSSVIDYQATTTLASTTTGTFGAAVTPTVNDCIVMYGQGFTTSTISGLTAGSGFTVPQWQSGVGGTNYGSAVAYQIQTTATTVGAAATLDTWTGAVAGVTVGLVLKAAAAGSGITISTPSAFEVHQRSGSTGSIQITGTYTGTPASIEASFNGGAYVTIVASPSGGTYTGTLTGQAQGQGTLTVRFTDVPATLATVANVGIGDVFVVGGDSISEGRGTNPQSYTHATLKAAKFTEADAWGEGNDGIDTGTSAGSHWPLLATQIMASQGVPVAFISTGTGSTDVAGSHSEWAKPNGNYTGLTSQVTDSTAASVKGVLMHLGPNAVVNASTLSLATYNSALDTLAANLAADVAGAPKLNLGIFGETSTGSPPDRTAALNNLRGAIIQAHGDNANIKPGPCLIDLDYSDGVHPQSDVALQAVAARWWLALSETYYGGSGGRGPRLSSASWNAGRDQLTVAFDRALKTGLSHATACWAVSDNGSAMTVSSVAYHGSNPNALVLTTSAAAVGAANTTTLTFANGDTAVGVVVPRSTDITMPVGAVVTIPAEPIYAAAVAEVDVTAPSLSGASFTGTGATTGTASVTTANDANGTLYCVVTTSATTPTGAQIRAGQDAAGATAAYSSSQAISSTGSKSFSATGLTASTTYYAHFQHRDAQNNDSTVVSSADGATSAPAPAPAPAAPGGLPRVGLLANGQLVVLFP